MADLSTTKLISLDQLSTYNTELKNNVIGTATMTTTATKLKEAINEVDADITTLNGDDTTTGSVAKAIKDKVESLDTTADVVIASKDATTNKVTLKAGVKEVDGIIAQGTGTDITLGTAANADTTATAIADGSTDTGLVTSQQVATYVKGKVEGLDTAADIELATVASSVVTIKAIKEVDGVIAASTDTTKDVTLAKIATTGTAADVAIVDAESKITATNVEDALTELAKAVETGGSGSIVYLDKNTTPDTGYAATYVLAQGKDASGNKKEVGRIQIPLDYLVKSATVKTCTTKDDPISGLNVGDKYIDFTVNVKEGTATDEHLYIAVKDMVTEVTVASGATEVQLALSASNEMSATLVDGGVSAAKLATDAVETAKIKDVNVTTAKIADDAITDAKIADDAVLTAAIKDGNVTTAKIADDAITDAKIADDAVLTAAIKDANVTAAKLAADSIACAYDTDGKTVKSSTMNATTVALLQKAHDAVQESDITLATDAEIKALFS